jgi:hypothetical protein
VVCRKRVAAQVSASLLKAPFPWFGKLPDHIGSKIGAPVNTGYITDCWPWKAALTNGYGVIWYQKRVQRAHRVIRMLLEGDFEQSLELDHLCRNRACVNPAHNEPVTQIVNNSRSDSASARHARQTHCLRGHSIEDPNNVYYRRRGHKTERFCRLCCKIRNAERYKRRKPVTEVKAC